MRRTSDGGTSSWTIDAYATDAGTKPVWAFIQALEGNDKVEAIALVKLLEIKKRDDIPVRTLERMRSLQAEVMRRATPQGRRRKRR